MIFEISRTSFYCSTDTPPCEGATPSQRVRVDTRIVDDPAKLLYPNAVKEWYNIGTNHRVESGRIKRVARDGDEGRSSEARIIERALSYLLIV
jgi:hypothetical protein